MIEHQSTTQCRHQMGEPLLEDLRGKSRDELLDPVQTDRDRQYSFFPYDVIFQQDQDLLDFVRKNEFKNILLVGQADYFLKYFDQYDSGPADFCVFMVLKSYDFDFLIDQINYLCCSSLLGENAVLYVSFNRHMAIPKRYDLNLSDDYDEAIGTYIKARVNANLLKYLPCGDDRGNEFNWVHPRTRFYFQK